MNLRDRLSQRTASPSVGDTDLPIIDLAHASDNRGLTVAERIRAACERSGFFYVVNHGVAASIVRQTFEENRRFHDLEIERKQAVLLNRHFRGYQPLGGSTLKLSTEGAARRSNHSESFFVRHAYDSHRALDGHRSIDGPNQWPGDLPGFQQTVWAYHDAMVDLGHRLVDALAPALGFEGAVLRERYFQRPSTTLRLLHYPPHPEGAPEDLFGIAPHTDYGFLTILAQEGQAGLEVRDPGGTWVEAPPIGDSFLINVGDAFARMTNDRFRSTPHRVVNPAPDRSRYSLAFFFDPSLDATIACLDEFIDAGVAPRYAPVTYGEYFEQRLATNYPARTS
jgi:isopenicillin N synthase-like dioxygenase